MLQSLRLSVGIVSLFAVSAASAQVTVEESFAQPSFCERMAEELGLKPTTDPKYYDGRPTWRINKLGGIGTFLFGGRAYLSMGVGTDFAYGPEDFQRLNQACKMKDRTYTCLVAAPDYIQIGVNDQQARFDPEEGEAAEVVIQKASVICRDGWPEGMTPPAPKEEGVGEET